MQVNLGFGVTQSTSRRSDSRPSNARSAERNCGINERQKEFVCLFDCLFVCLFVCLFDRLFVCKFVCLFVFCLFDHLFVSSFIWLPYAGINFKTKESQWWESFHSVEFGKESVMQIPTPLHPKLPKLRRGMKGWRDEGMMGWWDEGKDTIGKNELCIVKISKISP